MKKEYSEVPETMKEMHTYGFSWMDFVTAIPAPLFVVTSYKSNGMANACLQSWASFSGSEAGFFAILSNVNRAGHMYQTIKETGVCVLNFPSEDSYERCQKTIVHNQWEVDEILEAGLHQEKAVQVHAPRILESQLSLECQYHWEKELVAEGPLVLCLKVIHIAISKEYLKESPNGRYGQGGYLYNVHYPVNPEQYVGKSNDALATLEIIRYFDKY